MFKYYGGSTENDIWNGFYSDELGDLTIHTDESTEIVFFHLNFTLDSLSYAFLWHIKGQAQFVLNTTDNLDTVKPVQTFPFEAVIEYLSSESGDIDEDHKTFILDMIALNSRLPLTKLGDGKLKRLLYKLPFGGLVVRLIETVERVRKSIETTEVATSAKTDAENEESTSSEASGETKPSTPTGTEEKAKEPANDDQEPK